MPDAAAGDFARARRLGCIDRRACRDDALNAAWRLPLAPGAGAPYNADPLY